MNTIQAVTGAVLTSLAFTTWPLHAQPCPPDVVTEWRPRSFRASAPTAAAERASMEATLRAAEAMVRATAYSKPRGFTVTPTWQYGDATDGSRLRSYEFWTMISHNCSGYDASGSDITIVFNPALQSWSEGDRPMPDENGDGLFTERVRTEPLFGATAAFGRFHADAAGGLILLFTNGELPMLPVSREEYLRAMIFTFEGKDQVKLKEALEHVSKTPYQRWVEGAAERKQRNEETAAAIAQANPAQAAKFRADMEKAEREESEKLKRNEPEEREQMARLRAGITRPGDDMRAQLAAMTPAERASPAWTDGADLVPAGTPGAHAVIRANPAFYRPRQTPVEVRAILVQLQNVPPERSAQNRVMYGQFDWTALKQLLGK